MAIVKKAVEFQEGRVIEFTCTYDVVVGDVVPLGTGLVGIAVKSGLFGEVITLELEKVWTIKAKDSDAIAVGDKVYWDNTTKELTKTTTSNTYAGISISAKSTSAGTINVKINR